MTHCVIHTVATNATITIDTAMVIPAIMPLSDESLIALPECDLFTEPEKKWILEFEIPPNTVKAYYFVIFVSSCSQAF